MYIIEKGATDILGLEATGVVAAVGPGCKLGFKVGDRVMVSPTIPGDGCINRLHLNLYAWEL